MTEQPSPEYCFLWIDHWATCMSKAEWSGWVQAVGSIIAIFVTGLAVWWAHRLERRAAQRDGIAADVDAVRPVFDLLEDYLKLHQKLWKELAAGTLSSEVEFNRAVLLWAELRDGAPPVIPDRRISAWYSEARFGAENASIAIRRMWSRLRHPQDSQSTTADVDSDLAETGIQNLANSLASMGAWLDALNKRLTPT